MTIKECKELKPGDLVLCIKSSLGGGFKEGNVYTVKNIEKIDRYYYSIKVELDDKGSTTNGFHIKHFNKLPRGKATRLLYGK